MAKKETINVQGTAITVLSLKEDDYISLTDMADAVVPCKRRDDTV